MNISPAYEAKLLCREILYTLCIPSMRSLQRGLRDRLPNVSILISLLNSNDKKSLRFVCFYEQIVHNACNFRLPPSQLPVRTRKQRLVLVLRSSFYPV